MTFFIWKFKSFNLPGFLSWSRQKYPKRFLKAGSQAWNLVGSMRFTLPLYKMNFDACNQGNRTIQGSWEIPASQLTLDVLDVPECKTGLHTVRLYNCLDVDWAVKKLQRKHNQKFLQVASDTMKATLALSEANFLCQDLKCMVHWIPMVAWLQREMETRVARGGIPAAAEAGAAEAIICVHKFCSFWYSWSWWVLCRNNSAAMSWVSGNGTSVGFMAWANKAYLIAMVNPLVAPGSGIWLCGGAEYEEHLVFILKSKNVF